MGQIKNIIQKQIATTDKQKFFPTSATILDYDRLYNTATIRFLNPNGDGYMVRRNVPVSSNLGTLSNNSIITSHECIISFINGNIFSPIIIGPTTSTYPFKEMSDQGSYLVDESIRQTDVPTTITPMYKDWIDDDVPYGTYDNDLCPYKDLDIKNELYDALTNLNHYSDTETGLTHLATHSGIKLKDNGDIDVFVSDNVGIRISKETHKIYLYGFDVNINGEIDLMEIVNMVKNFKCRYEPIECQCDMDAIQNAFNDINLKLEQISSMINTVPTPEPEPHRHTMTDMTLEIGFENDGRLHPTLQEEKVHVTVVGGKPDDGCPFNRTGKCTGTGNKMYSWKDDDHFDIIINDPGLYVILITSKDEYGEIKVATETIDIRGADGERSSTGQFVGSSFDSGWFDVDVVNGCYINKYHYDLKVNSGHSCDNDRIAVIGKKTNGDVVVICDLFNIGTKLSFTPFNGDILSLTAGNLLGDVWQDEGILSLADDIRQIKFIARTDPSHENCVREAIINFSLSFTWDKSLYVE